MYKKVLINFIFIIIIVICIAVTYKYFNVDNVRPEITSVSSIDIFKFNSFSKFSNEKIDVIDNEQKLSKFKMLINSLDISDEIRQTKLSENINLESFEYYFHIRPEIKYIKDDKVHDGFFLLHILINNLDENSYITFSGTELSYILDSNNTKILKEIFVDVKY